MNHQRLFIGVQSGAFMNRPGEFACKVAQINLVNTSSVIDLHHQTFFIFSLPNGTKQCSISSKHV